MDEAFRAHAKAGVGLSQSGAEAPAQAAPALTAQHVGGGSTAEGPQSLPTHLCTGSHHEPAPLC